MHFVVSSKSSLKAPFRFIEQYLMLNDFSTIKMQASDQALMQWRSEAISGNPSKIRHFKDFEILHPVNYLDTTNTPHDFFVHFLRSIFATR